jgi:hypothetical protein
MMFFNEGLPDQFPSDRITTSAVIGIVLGMSNSFGRIELKLPVICTVIH